MDAMDHIGSAPASNSRKIIASRKTAGGGKRKNNPENSRVNRPPPAALGSGLPAEGARLGEKACEVGMWIFFL